MTKNAKVPLRQITDDMKTYASERLVGLRNEQQQEQGRMIQLQNALNQSQGKLVALNGAIREMELIVNANPPHLDNSPKPENP